MRKAYYYLYFRIYSLALKAQGSDAGLFAAFFLSLILFLDVMAAIALLGKLDLVHLFPKNKWQSLLTGVAIFVINYLVFVRKGRYREIISRYPAETLKQKIAGGLLVGLVTVASFIFLLKIILYKPGIA
jgi:hypothetical protein